MKRNPETLALAMDYAAAIESCAAYIAVNNPPIQEPGAAYKLLRPLMTAATDGDSQEGFFVVLLNTKNKIIGAPLEVARGLLDTPTAYDYVFRAGKHPSAATQAAHAKGTITWDGDLGEVQPLPKFAPEELGDCIDCTICVQVCPTGIDIRNGLQYECIACGACIDACNDVMGKMGYPRGLIRYTTQNAIDGKPSKVLRPRIFVYGTILLALVAAWGWGVFNRDVLIAEVLRDRNALYREVADGQVENSYTLKLVNKDQQSHRYVVTLASGSPGIRLRDGDLSVSAAPEEVLSLAVTATAPATLRGRHAVTFTVRDADSGAEKTVDTSYFGPTP